MVRFIMQRLTANLSNEQNLHSNMVRFIISQIKYGISSPAYIYIPIWLDLLLNHHKLKL